MISRFALLVCFSPLFAQTTNWIAAGNRALDDGNPREAATDFARALQMNGSGLSADDLVHLRVTLATAYMEAGDYRAAESVLLDIRKDGDPADGRSAAEVLNAWSAVHLKLGQLAEAEADLVDAQRILLKSPGPGDLMGTVLHNLAAIELRTGRYAEALQHERAALTQLEKTAPPDDAALIRAWASLASLQYMTGQVQDARLSMERALNAAESRYGPAHPLIADLLESDAIVLDRLKLKKPARQARDRARAIRASSGATAEQPLTWNVRDMARPGDAVYLRSK